jgi:hypothetical protein
MNVKNRIVDFLLAGGSLATKLARLVGSGMGLKHIISSPPILTHDADRTSATSAATASEDGQIRSITLREYSTEELVTIHQSRPNLLHSATIIEKTGTDSSRFGSSGSAKRGDALYTAEHNVIRRGMTEALRPLRERYNVATRGLAKDSVATSDRTVDVYLPVNAAGGYGNGALVPSGIDLRELGLQQGLERIRIHPYVIMPSTGNGANYQTAAAAAICSFRQMMAACLTPDVIRDEKLSGTRTPTGCLFDEPTIVCPTNGRVTMSNRDEAAGLVALDILLRGDARFSTDAYFTDFASRVHGGHIGRDMVCRAVGHTVIEFNPKRAADALDARLTREIAQRLLVGTNPGEHVEVSVCVLPEVTGLLESAQRPMGTDVAADTYTALDGASHDTIQATVLDAHGQLQQRADDYAHRLEAIAGEFVKNHASNLDQQVQHCVGTLGLPETVKRLQNARERQAGVAADYLQRYAANAGPDASAYQSLVGQMQEQAQVASHSTVLKTALVAALAIGAIGCVGTGMGMAFGLLGAILGWTLLSTGIVLAAAAVAVKAFASLRGTKRMAQLAIDAMNLDLAMFDNRVSNIRLMAGRNAISALAERLDRLHDDLSRAATKAQELAAEADSRFLAMAGGSVPLEVPGIVLPTNADIEAVVRKIFTPRMDVIAGPITLACSVNADAMVTQFRRCVQAEISDLKLDDVSVIDFLEHWPNDIDLGTFATERINESWPTAPIDPTVEPGYVPPILRIVRSDGGSRNSGPLVELLRKGQAEEVSQVRDQDFGDPRRIILSHERRFINFRQISYLSVLEREAQAVLAELEPFLVTAVADPRALDIFRCGGGRDEAGAWGSFFRAVARKIVTRNGDNTYIVRDAAFRGVLHVADDGRLAQGLPNVINRLTIDPTLRKTLDEMFLGELQREGKATIVQSFLAAMHSADECVPAIAVSKFCEIGLREVCKLLPECRTANDAARLVGFTPPATPPKPHKADRHHRPGADAPAAAGGADVQTGYAGVGDRRLGEAQDGGNGSGRHDKSVAGMPARRFA